MAFLQRSRPEARDTKTAAEAKPGGLIRFLLSLVIIAWAIRSFFIATFYIPSVSMLPTLYVGDYLFVAKWPYGYSRFSFPLGVPAFKGRILGSLPERGDVVVFRHPVDDADLIKRVIGLPGDTIEMRDGRLILNGRPIKTEQDGTRSVAVSPNSPCEPSPLTASPAAGQGATECVYPALRETLPGGPSYTVLDQGDSFADQFAPTTVPEGYLFVMGDNRDSSADSRIPPTSRGVGFLPTDHLIGKAMVTVWSTDGSASYLLPWTWFTALRGSRLGNGYSGDAE